MKRKLPITEDIDFHYLLSIMPVLCDQPEFACLPELFSIIDFDALVELCNYAGGETIRIPTITELLSSINALQSYYDCYIAKRITVDEIPSDRMSLVNKIVSVMKDAG